MGGELDMERRVTTVENWQSNHDIVCANRWGILIKLIGWGGGLAFVTTLGIAGWGVKTLYEGQQQQTAEIHRLLQEK